APDGRSLASGSAAGRVTVWELDPVRQVRAWVAATGNIDSLTFTPDGSGLGAAEWKERRVWGPSGGRPLPSLPVGGLGVPHPARHPDGSIIFGSDEDGVWFWGLDPNLRERVRLTSPPRIPAVAPAGRLAATVDEDGEVILWNVVTRRPIRRITSGHRALAL